MATHNAIAATSKGNIEHIQVPTAVSGPGEILLQVKFAALTPADVNQIDLEFLLGDNPWPHVPGLSGAGYVKAVGDGVSDLKEGDTVSTASIQSTYNPTYECEGNCIYFRPIQSQAVARVLHCSEDTRS